MCKSFSDAIAVSLHIARDRTNAAKVARYLTCSDAFLSQLKKGAKKSIPEWFAVPFCYATGTNLLRQFLDLEEAKVFLKRNKSPRENVQAIVYSMRNAA